MLQIFIPEMEFFDEKKEEFVNIKEQSLLLEHSLISISKWESIYLKPFLETEKTTEETLAYIKCMCITQNVDPLVFDYIPASEIKKITEYIKSPMTAVVFKESKDKPTYNKIITSEMIYYWMISYNIPAEYAKWHINRLLSLIRVCSSENAPKKKMSKKEIMQQNAALNAKRRAEFHSKG